MVIIDNVAVRTFKEKVPSTLNTLDLIGGRLFHATSVMFRCPVLDHLSQSSQVHRHFQK